MKIYLVINDTKNTQSITASDYLAKKQKEYFERQNEKCRVYEGELKTQGKNFHSWAQFIKEV